MADAQISAGYNANDPATKKVTLARLKLLNLMPFIGKFASTMKYYIINDDNDIPEGVSGDLSELPRTAYTDGRNIYYYRSFLDKLSVEETVFLTAHEVLHIIKDHLSRKGDRNPIYWNMACDYVINSTLKEFNVGKVIDCSLLDNKYTSKMTAEEVYDDLMKNNPPIQVTLDIHLDLSDEKDSDGKSPGVKVKVYGKKELTADDLREIKNEIKRKIISIYEQEKNNPNSLPGMKALGIDRVVEEIVNPKIDWRSLLREFVTSYMPHDVTYSSLSRRSFFTDFMHPGVINNDKVDVWIAIDTSGSITDSDVSQVKGELRNLVQTYDSFNLNLLCFDVDVYNPQCFDEFSLSDLDDYNFKGGGGTSLNGVFQYFKENDIKPKKLVVFTDGHIDGWGEPGYCDTVFLIKKGGNMNVPYGVAVQYE